MKHLILLLPLFLLGQSSAPEPVQASSMVLWDAPALNTDGTPCTDLAGYVVALSAADVDLSAGGAPTAQIQVVGAVTQQALEPMVTGLPPGPYKLWVQAYDGSGQKSAWAVPLDVVLDANVPGAPLNLRIKITVIVELPP